MRFILLSIIIIIFAVALVWFGKVAFEKPQTDTATNSQNAYANIPAISQPRVTIIDPIRGNRDAAVTIVEFGDYRCEFCHEQESVLQEVLSAYPNDVRLVWKDFPNDYLHPQATASAVAARCAGDQGKYWEYHDTLMARAAESNLISYADIAATLGLDRTTFQLCIDSNRTGPIVQNTLQEALALRLTDTPSFFINGHPFNGATFEEFKAAIDGLLKK